MAAGGERTLPSERCSVPVARLLPSRAKPPLEAKPQAAARHSRSSDPQGSEIVSGHCDSCGRDDEQVVAVHRVYVTPETWDTEGKVDVLKEVEQWCFVCRSHYPHQEVDDKA
jgi:hypothetical protein